MALKRTLENPHKPGDNYTDAYVKVVQTNIDHEDKTGKVTMNCYPSKTEADDKVVPFNQYSESFGIEDYDEYFADSKIKPVNKTVLERAYTFIKRSKLDDEGNEINKWKLESTDA